MPLGSPELIAGPMMTRMESASYTTDTSPEALAVQLECLRRMTPRQRIRKTCAMSRSVKKMAFDAIRRRHPESLDSEVQRLFIELTYGKMLANEARVSVEARMFENGVTDLSDSDDLVDALGPVVEALRRLNVRHFVGGSVASSFYGATRSTMDVDVVCDLTEEKISAFVASFDHDFYVSETAVREAVRRRSCFNLIHLPSSFKVDVFVSRGRPFDDEAMRRATAQRLGELQTVDVPIASPEDSILSKLERYRLTDETSERQWEDVSRLVSLIGDELDLDYLNRAAESLGVVELLARLLR